MIGTKTLLPNKVTFTVGKETEIEGGALLNAIWSIQHVTADTTSQSTVFPPVKVAYQEVT